MSEVRNKFPYCDLEGKLSGAVVGVVVNLCTLLSTLYSFLDVFSDFVCVRNSLQNKMGHSMFLRSVTDSRSGFF